MFYTVGKRLARESSPGIIMGLQTFRVAPITGTILYLPVLFSGSAIGGT